MVLVYNGRSSLFQEQQIQVQYIILKTHYYMVHS